MAEVRELTTTLKVTGLDEAMAKAKLLADTLRQVKDLMNELQTALNGLSVDLHR